MQGSTMIRSGETGFAQSRKAMVESQLRPSGVNDVRVIAAMARVPREAFVPAERIAVAYSDRPIPLGRGREMNPPTITGRLLTELHIQPSDRALLIGAGTGYAAALLSELVADLVAVEDDPRLFQVAQEALADTDGALVEGPLAEGHAPGAPYDVILIDGAVEHIPQALIAQLAQGGRLAAGLVGDRVCRLVIGRRSGPGFGTRDFEDADAVRLPGFARPKAFTF